MGRPDQHRQQAEQAPQQAVDERQQHLEKVPATLLILQQNPSSQYGAEFPSGTGFWAAQRPGAGTGQAGRPGPYQRQIAAELRISARTVGSHLDRIRDKTGCRRRADLTRLALAKGLV